jgi:small subunit ribosomal protein S1
MKESFAELFEQSVNQPDALDLFREGTLIKAKIIAIQPDKIVVNANLKSDSMIPAIEFRGEEIKVGDLIDAVIVNPVNAFGDTVLSHELAKRAAVWVHLEKKHTSGETVKGTIIERVKGGFTVVLDGVQAFLPGSLVDIKPIRDPGYLEGKELDFKVIKMDKKRNNIVVSRRAVLEAESSAERRARLDELEEGQRVVGIVKNITDYGAFIDLGGIDGLLHITDISWKRVKHPSEVLKVGDEIKVKVLKFDREKNRVSLGLKQLGDDPWQNIAERYPAGARLVGRVTNITDYGCFVEIEEGVEGLVHMSEMDWTNKNIHPSKVVNAGDEVDVMVLDIDQERRRISLGVKQCKPNPWQEFTDKHEAGEKVSGKIRSITDFGVFIGLDGGIDGLVHLSDISWAEAGEEAVRNYKKGDEVEAVILAMDPERERISLGIKQLESDPFSEYSTNHAADEVVNVKVKQVEAKQAVVEIEANVLAILKASDFSSERIKDLREKLKEDEEIEVKISQIDKKNRQIYVSRKALDADDSSSAKVRNVTDQPAKTTLGDLLREQMRQKEEGQEK